LPESPGVYLMRNSGNRVLYVGKAANLRARVRSYFQSPEAEDRKLLRLRDQMFTVDFRTVDTELDALLLEHRLILRLKPEINRQKKIIFPLLPQSARAPSIFLIPVRPSVPTATKGRVIVYFLSAFSLERVSVRIGRKPGQRLGRALSNFYDEVVSAAPAPERRATTSRAALEIAARWLLQNAENVSIIDPADCASLPELRSRLLALLRTPEIFTAKIQFSTP